MNNSVKFRAHVSLNPDLKYNSTDILVKMIVYLRLGDKECV